MVFSSILFMFIYLPVVLALYYIAPVRWRNAVLFVVNLVFYGWGEPVYIVLMLFSITVNYFAGRMIEKHRAEDKKARAFLIGNIVINLALLMFFKYFDLFAQTLSQIPGVSIAPLGLSLPIGISFYTFQTMSYPIDVYRGDADVQKNFVSFGTFVALFPQLIAGPIVRYKDVASQLDFRAGSVEQFSSGVRRFLVGAAKKVLIANNIGVLWDTFSAMPSEELTVLGAWIGIIGFSLQIYFDFSGYSDMAIGLGRMLGFEFLENFNYPYISQSVTEFWRRWHISLGTCLYPARRQPPRAEAAVSQHSYRLGAHGILARRELDVPALGAVLRGIPCCGEGFPASCPGKDPALRAPYLRGARSGLRLGAVPA